MGDVTMKHRWATRITTNPEILLGKPIVAGTRISVELILDCMASGWSVDKVVEAYPPHYAGRCIGSLGIRCRCAEEETVCNRCRD